MYSLIWPLSLSKSWTCDSCQLIIFSTRTSVAQRRHLVLIGILADWQSSAICISVTEYLQWCYSQTSIFYMSDAFIGCWLIMDGISIFYMSVADLAD